MSYLFSRTIYAVPLENMQNICLIVLMLCLALATQGQSLHYDAIRKDRIIGGMEINVSKNKDQQIFEINSNMEFRVIVTLRVEFENREIFKGGILQSGVVKNRMIGFKESDATITKIGNNYELIINGDPEPLIDKPINYSVSTIYTQEPFDGQKVFSQYYGKYFTFVKTEEHVYKYSSPEGDNHYTYLNGICTDVKIERDFATVYFKLQPESLAAVKENGTQFKTND